MPTTSNFGWTTPADTDLVKDGAAAIRTLGNGIDTSFVDLKGGTTGQVLSKNSNTDLDFTWVTSDDANAIQNAIVDAKGDLIAASAADTPARLAVGNNGETLVADSSASVGLRYQSGVNTNAIINGGMDIWQRGTSFIGTAYNKSADRWVVVRDGFAAGLTASRSTDKPTGFTYSMKLQRDSGNTGTGVLYLTSSLETADSLRFAGKTVVLSFWAKAGANYSAASSILTSNIMSGDGTDQSGDTPTLWTNANSQTQSNTLTTSWQRFTHTVSITSARTQIAVRFNFTPVGTAGADDSAYITGVQLELGSVPTEFKRAGNTFGGELIAAQRYYWRPIEGTATDHFLMNGYAFTTTDVRGIVTFPTTMRVAPSLVTTGGTNYFQWQSATSDSFDNFLIFGATQHTALLYAQSAQGVNGVVAGQGGGFYTLNAAASVAFNAEL